MAATFVPGSALRVVNAGTPVQVPIPTGFVESNMHALLIQTLPTNTGKIYIGNATLNKGALSGLIVFLAVPTANVIPSFSVSVTQAANALKINDLWIDADNSNDGVIVSGILA